MEIGILFALVIIEVCAINIAIDVNSIKKDIQDMKRCRVGEGEKDG